MFGNLFGNRRHPDYDDDFFRDTRMSFGDHLEELRTRMWRAIKGLGICLFIGFILDGIGERAGLPWLGIGRPMLKVITDPVKEQVKQFYADRAEAAKQKLDAAREHEDNARIQRTVELPGSFRTDQFPGREGPVEIHGK